LDIVGDQTHRKRAWLSALSSSHVRGLRLKLHRRRNFPASLFFPNTRRLCQEIHTHHWFYDDYIDDDYWNILKIRYKK
jgi:hypothetical protein